jgi:hypothetical protein
MTIKISELGNLTVFYGNTVVPVVADIFGTPTTLKANGAVMKTYITSDVVASISSLTTTVNVLSANAAAQSGAIASLDANAAVQAGAIVTANTAMKGYVDAITTSWQANAAAQAGDIATLTSNAAVQAGAIASATTAITTANTAMKGYVDGQISTANTAMKGYVDGQISSLVDSAPSTLDTLNEIASALGDDANLSVTLTSYIGNVNANIGTANTAMKGYVDGQVSTLTSNAAVQAGAIVTANTAMKGYVDGQVSTLTSNAAVQAGLINDVTVAFNNYSPNAAVVSFVTINPLQTTQGGTGANNAGTAGNVLTSDGTNWTSTAPGGLLNNIQYFTTAGTATYTATAGTSFIVVSVVGGGGGGTGDGGTSSFGNVCSATGGLANGAGGFGAGGDINTTCQRAPNAYAYNPVVNNLTIVQTGSPGLLYGFGAGKSNSTVISSGQGSVTGCGGGGYSSKKITSAFSGTTVTVGAVGTGSGTGGTDGCVIVYEYK